MCSGAMYNGKRRLPQNGTFELTGRCNLSCKMCLVRVDQEQICKLGMRERTAEEWIHMAEQVRDAGTLGLLLTGGEVMLRPDFCEIYEAISKMGFILTVYTNATMVTDKIMETFRRLPPHQIGVTMYGASNETYGKMCGCKDGYDRFVEGVRKLSSLPSLFAMRTTIIQDNLHDLAAMKAFTKEMFGQDKTLTISRFVAEKVRGGVANPKACRLTPEQNVEMCHREIMELLYRVRKGEIELPLGVEKFPKVKGMAAVEGNYLFEHCKAGMNNYAIAWNGRMYACEVLNEGYTEPFVTGFIDAWEHLPEQYPKSLVPEKCKTCEYAALCETCPANRLAETGDWFGVPEYACREAEYMYEILSEMEMI